MSRRHVAEKREILPDPKYGDLLIGKFMNYLMYEGKKSVAETIVYGALDMAKDKTKSTDVQKLMHDAINTLKPTVEVRSRRIGGATYQVPVEINDSRKQALAMRWLIQASRGRSEKTMVERLAAELVDVTNGRGSAMKKREDVHKMADANKAFAHYRW